MILLVPALGISAELAGRLIIYVNYGESGKSYGIYTGDPVLGHFPAPNSYNHNAKMNDWGFRNNEDVIEPRPPGTLRIIAYGGSTTYLPSEVEEDTWSSKLQQKLRRKAGGSSHQVLNGGIVLWSIGHAYERARREIPKLKPDFVIIYSGVNDEGNAVFVELDGKDVKQLVEQKRWGFVTKNFPATLWIQRNSLLFKLFNRYMMPISKFLYRGALDMPTAKRLSPNATPQGEPSEPDRYILANYLAVLRNFIALTRKHGGKVIFIVQATPFSYTEINRLIGYSAAGAVVARREGAVVLDAREIVKAYTGDKTDLFRSGSPIHLNAKGGDLMAAMIVGKAFKSLPE